MIANDMQIGGDHYRSSWQLWDFVEVYAVGYMEACIAKYIIRHRKKNGKEDLEKALHYTKKLIELADKGRVSRNRGVDLSIIDEFCVSNHLTYPESRICLLLFGNWATEDLMEVHNHIEDLLLTGYPRDEAQAHYEVG